MKPKLSLDKDKIKIILLEGIHPNAVKAFNKQGYFNVDRQTDALPAEKLRHKIKGAHMIGIRSRTQITAELLERADKLIAIGCFCIGTNQVDLDTTTLMGLPVFNAPHSNTRSVAELVIGLTIMLMRGIFPKSMAAHRQEWQKSSLHCHEVRGKTLGIVGYGHIGSQVSILGEALGLTVLYYDIKTQLPLGNAKGTVSLEELMEKSDVVSLHVPEDETTRAMINERSLRWMKRGSYLINASRGSVVDIDAVAAGLKSGRLLGAAIDVFPKEPKSNEEPFHSPLIRMENVILTPHIAGSTQEAQENIGTEVAQKLVRFSDQGTTEGSVNFPMVNLTPNLDTHRILHIHHNVPGILKQINDTLAGKDINVLGQFLATNQKIGYVVLDIAKGVSGRVDGALRQIEGTIRMRVLY